MSNLQLLKQKNPCAFIIVRGRGGRIMTSGVIKDAVLDMDRPVNVNASGCWYRQRNAFFCLNPPTSIYLSWSTIPYYNGKELKLLLSCHLLINNGERQCYATYIETSLKWKINTSLPFLHPPCQIFFPRLHLWVISAPSLPRKHKHKF